MNSLKRGPVVVGVDGSAHARSAVDYAAWEASRRGLTLRLVHGVRPVLVRHAHRPVAIAHTPES